MSPNIAQALVRILELKDHATAAHTWRVVLYTRTVAEELGLPHDEVDRIGIAAALHDIGKIDIPDELLLKPGKLTSEEFDIMAHNLNPDFIIMHGSFSVDSHIPVINKIKLNDCDDCFNHFIIHVPDAFESLSEAELNKLKELGNRENVFLEFEHLSSDAVKFALKYNIGLSLKASSEEEKTGVRSFEELDDVFDLINEQE